MNLFSRSLRVAPPLLLWYLAACGPADTSSAGDTLGFYRAALTAPTDVAMAQPFGNAVGGDRRMITGLNFNATGRRDMPKVWIGEIQATPYPGGLWQDDKLEVLVPSAVPGTVGLPLEVAVDNGASFYTTVMASPFHYYSDSYALGYRNSVKEMTGSTAAVAFDVNRDGNIDRISASNSTVQAFLSNGRGGFGPPVISSVSVGQPVSMASADFNGDGNRDLVVGSNDRLQILLGKGDGTFLGGALYWVDPLQLVIADFNNDGIDDIAALNSWSNYLVVFSGLRSGGVPTGTFSQTNYFIGSRCASVKDIKAADINGDSYTDLVVACLSNGRGANGGLLVLTNTTNDPLSSTRPFDPGTAKTYLPDRNLLAVAAMDVDGDKRTDLVASEDGSTAVLVLKQQPTDPRFSSFTQIGVGDTYRTLTSTLEPRAASPIVDVCSSTFADGINDLLLSRGTDNPDSVSILTGVRGGLFAAHKSIELGMTTFDVGIADVNKDGCVDLVAFGGQPAVGFPGTELGSMLLGGPGLTFQKSFDFPLSPQVSAADGFKTSTGEPVLVTADVTTDTVQSLKLIDNADPVPLSTVSVPGAPNALMLGEVTGDAIQDAITLNLTGKSATVLKGTAGGALTLGATVSVGDTPSAGALGDVDGDGKLDLVVLHSDGSVLALKGDGVGGFTMLASIARTSKSVVTIATANLYGTKQEVILAKDNGKSDDLSKSDQIEIWQFKNTMVGFGTMPDYTLDLGAKRTKAIVAADVNGDSRLDLLVANAKPALGEITNFRVLLGDGAGGFNRSTDYSFKSCEQPTQVMLADVNRDTLKDITIACNDGPAIQTWLAVGRGYFAQSRQYVSQPGSSLLVSADIDKDRRPELVVIHQSVPGMRGTGSRADIVRNQTP